MRLASFLMIVAAAYGQLVLTKDQMVAFTPQNPYERFADGRPIVPDDLLEKVKGLVIEEAYGAVKAKGFPNQFAGD
jgi:4-hydroxy-4-methyl-2-oxoglutarate aldolase